MASLQDQLLKAGLTNKKKVNVANSEKRKLVRQQKKGLVEKTEDEIKQAVLKAEKEQAEHSRLLNKEIKEQADQKALQAQIRQLITMNQIHTESDAVNYQFSDNGKIKNIAVSHTQQKQLASGILGIATLDNTYIILHHQVLTKIAERDASAIILQNSIDSTSEEDDFYADYQIPDDLMW